MFVCRHIRPKMEVKRIPLEGISSRWSDQYLSSEVACGFYLESVHCAIVWMRTRTDGLSRQRRRRRPDQAAAAARPAFYKHNHHIDPCTHLSVGQQTSSQAKGRGFQKVFSILTGPRQQTHRSSSTGLYPTLGTLLKLCRSCKYCTATPDGSITAHSTYIQHCTQFVLVAVGGQGGGWAGEGRMAHIGDRLRSLIVLLSRGWGGRRVGSRIAAVPPVPICVYVYICVFLCLKYWT